MITDDIDHALVALTDALDPDALARDVLTTTGENLVAYDREHGAWTDRTGELRDGFRFELEEGTQAFVLTEMNDVEHAPFVYHNGFSILSAFDGGAAEGILHAAFRRHKRSGTI